MRYETRLIRSRDDLRVDTLYVHEDTSEAFYTPDAIGLIFFDTEEEGFEQLGVTASESRLLTAEEFSTVADS